MIYKLMAGMPDPDGQLPPHKICYGLFLEERGAHKMADSYRKLGFDTEIAEANIDWFDLIRYSVDDGTEPEE